MKGSILSLFLCLTVGGVLSEDIVCSSGTKSTDVVINKGDVFKFSTAGKRYPVNADCSGNYQLGDCPAAEVTCTKFKTAANKKCTKGDIMTVTDDNGTSKFCKKKKPVNKVLSGDFSIRFTSDGKKQSKGMKCTVKCTDDGSGSVVVTTPPGDPCKVNLDKLTGNYPPLLLQNRDFIFPTSEDENEERILDIADGSELELFCHGSTKYQDQTYVELTGVPEEKSAKLTCNNGAFFSGDTEVTVEGATCNRRQEPRLTRSQEECSPLGADGRTTDLGDLWLIQIGWEIEDTFIEQIRLCHDEKVYGTIWTHHTLYGPNIDFRDISSGRPGFRIDNTYLKRFYTWTTSTNMNDYYSKNDQESTAVQLYGQNEINGQPIIENTSSGTNYFAKGHLSPDAAFVYDVLQDATYYFFNVAPQFQSFNNGNWKALEYNTRDLAIKGKKILSVYTGIHGLLTYPDTNNNEVPFYVYSEDSLSYIPAPLYYWKVVHDPAGNTAVAFIGLNDPHATEAPTELCTNVCSQMEWVDWDITTLSKGYMYCCSVEDARAAIPSMPDIKGSSLLQLVEVFTQATCNAGPCSCTCESSGCTCQCNGVDVPVNGA